jgi:hypothetical protein
MTVLHRTIVGGAEVAWEVDTSACGTAARWAARRPKALADDLAGMAEYFPHWMLAGTVSGRVARCETCDALLVPQAGVLRCVVCCAASHADGLAWVGHLPSLARVEPRFVSRQAALRDAGFAETQAGGVTYLLVPLLVGYPAEWPSQEPAVRYSRRWLDALGLPRMSGAHHLINDSQACLFAWGQWSAMSIHAVLQQRVVNHVVSLLKIAAGHAPEAAFIGRIHHEAWEAERGETH